MTRPETNKPRSGMLRSLALLVSGTLLAQAVNFAATPVLSRLFSPADFGVLGLLNAVTNLFSGIAALRYDLAIVVPKRASEAVNTLLVSLTVVGAVTLASLGLVAAGRLPLARLFGSPELADWLWLSPLVVGATGVYNVLSFWCTRQKLFRRLSISQVVAAMSSLGAKLGGGALGLGAPGLVGGQILGQMIATLALGLQVLIDDGRQIGREADRRQMRTAAREHAEFPKYQAPTTVLNALAQNLPVYFLGARFGSAAVGQWALTMVLVAMPVGIVANALRQVLLQRLSEAAHQGESVYALTRRATLWLALLGTPVAAAGALAAPWAFPWILGAHWTGAGAMAPYVVLWQLSVLVGVPAVAAFPIVRMQRHVLVWQVLSLPVTATALAAGASLRTMGATVAAFAVATAAMNIALSIVVLHGARRASGSTEVRGASEDADRGGEVRKDTPADDGR